VCDIVFGDLYRHKDSIEKVRGTVKLRVPISSSEDFQCGFSVIKINKHRGEIMKILPYVYQLTHTETNEFYIGVRWGNKVPASDDLGKKYFSSSVETKPRFSEFIPLIIAEFFDKEDAIEFEQQLITEHWGNPLLLNKAIQVSKTFRCSGHSEETKQKMSNSKKGKPPNNKGTKLSAERVEQIRKRASEYRHTDESIEKIRQKALGNKRGVGNKSRTGQQQSVDERLKKSESLKGEKNPNFGKSLSEWQKEIIRAAMLNRPKLKCPHYSKELDPANYKRYHGDKCKSRIDS